MKLKQTLFVLLCTVLTFTAVGTASAQAAEGPVQALAYEQTFAKNVDWTDTYKYCSADGLGVVGCVQPYGDTLWLLDRWSDGHGVSLTWKEWREGPDVQWWPTGREGKCINNLGSAVKWTACDKNFGEGNLITWEVQYWDNGAWHQAPFSGSYWTVV